MNVFRRGEQMCMFIAQFWAGDAWLIFKETDFQTDILYVHSLFACIVHKGNAWVKILFSIPYDYCVGNAAEYAILEKCSTHSTRINICTGISNGETSSSKKDINSSRWDAWVNSHLHYNVSYFSTCPPVPLTPSLWCNLGPRWAPCADLRLRWTLGEHKKLG